jgi:hypothetical protein
MRGIRFWLIGVASFITITLGTFFVSGSFLNRALSTIFCAIFSFSSTFCVPNLEVESDPVMATNITTPEKDRDAYNDLRDTNKQRNLLAFDSFNTDRVEKHPEIPEGHRGITLQGLEGDKINGLEGWVSPTDKKTFLTDSPKGSNLSFTKESRIEIERAVRHVDLREYYLGSTGFGSAIAKGTAGALETPSNPNMPIPSPVDPENSFQNVFSPDFDFSYKHFDRETFALGSWRLIKFKQEIKSILDPIPKAFTSTDELQKAQERGKMARQYLGKALHTLQDFYAHSNWVELGNKNINEDLGEKFLCEEPQFSELEILKNQNVPDPDLDKIDQNTFLKDMRGISKSKISCSERPDPSKNKIGEPTAVGPLKSPRGGPSGYDQGKLDPNLKKLTSGYYMGNTSPCAAPLGKVRHGFITCDGLNKDSYGRPGYEEAANLGVKASVNYIHQIIDPLAKDGKIEAIKALMGMSGNVSSVPASSGSEYEFQVVAKTGMIVDGQKLVNPARDTYSKFPTIFSNGGIGGYSTRLIDDHGHIVYFDSGSLFLDDKVIAFQGKIIDNFVVNKVGDFFLFKNGTLDVLVEGFDTQKKRNSTIIIRNGKPFFGYTDNMSSGFVSTFYPECTPHLKWVRCASANAYYYRKYNDSNAFRFDANGFKEVSIQEVEKGRSYLPDPDPKGRFQCIGNNKNQTICSLSPVSSFFNQGILVRDDNKIFPAGCCDFTLNNNGKILIRTGLVLLDYDKDAIEGNHQITKKDLETALKLHSLKVPYGKLLDIPKRFNSENMGQFAVQLADNGDLLLIVMGTFGYSDVKTSFDVSAIIRGTPSRSTNDKS